jgi:hypothetical protein
MALFNWTPFGSLAPSWSRIGRVSLTTRCSHQDQINTAPRWNLRLLWLLGCGVRSFQVPSVQPFIPSLLASARFFRHHPSFLHRLSNLENSYHGEPNSLLSMVLDDYIRRPKYSHLPVRLDNPLYICCGQRCRLLGLRYFRESHCRQSW